MDTKDVIQAVEDAPEDVVTPSEEPSVDETVEPSEADGLRKELLNEMSNHGRTKKAQVESDKKIAKLEAEIAEADKRRDEQLLEGLEGYEKTEAQKLIDLKKTISANKKAHDKREKELSDRESALTEKEKRDAPLLLKNLVAEVAESARVTPESLRDIMDTVGMESPTKEQLEGLTKFATRVSSPHQTISTPVNRVSSAVNIPKTRAKFDQFVAGLSPEEYAKLKPDIDKAWYSGQIK